MSFKGAWGNRRRSVCVLKGSSVSLTCSNAKPAANVFWYTAVKDDSTYHLTKLPADGNYVAHKATKDRNATLTIVEVRERDESVYCCQENGENAELCWNEGTELRVAGTDAAPPFFICLNIFDFELFLLCECNPRRSGEGVSCLRGAEIKSDVHNQLLSD